MSMPYQGFGHGGASSRLGCLRWFVAVILKRIFRSNPRIEGWFKVDFDSVPVCISNLGRRTVVRGVVSTK